MAIPETTLIPTNPDPGLARLAAQFLEPNSRVLDLGAGRGRNALYLAAQGHEVVAVEQNAAYVEEIQARRRFLGRAATNLLVVEADMEEQGFERGTFDAVCMTGVLHELASREIADRILRNARQATVQRGHHFITNYIAKPEEQARLPHRVLPQPNEIRNDYVAAAWHIKHMRQVLQPMKFVQGSWYYGSFDEIAAQKPVRRSYMNANRVIVHV